MFRQDFQRLSVVRMREAKVLARAGHHDGAFYLGGMAIECALEACIARATRRHEFPDRQRTNRVHTHDLEDLLKLAGLERRLTEADPDARAAWTSVKARNVETRYTIGKSEAAVTDFLNAASGRNGVLRWLRQFWLGRICRPK